MATPFVVGTSTAIRGLIEDIELAARSSAPVLIAGERGCRKRQLARLIHESSVRSNGAFKTIRCTGDDEISDALAPFIGTIFFDEIGELTHRKQAEVWQFLESSRGSWPRDFDQPRGGARLIAATRHRLIERVQANAFRQDLYYRVNVVYLQVPPLRDHANDIPVLLAHYFELLSERHQRPIPALDADAEKALLEYSWPENVRELMNVAEDLILSCHTGRIHLSDLPRHITAGCRT